MPGAYLKGNSSFPDTSFSVDHIARPWDVYGPLQPVLLLNAEFIKEHDLAFTYYKLKHLVVISVHGTIVPSTIPYTGKEDDTSFVYSGSFNFPEQNFSTLKFDIGSSLACDRNAYQAAMSVLDKRGEIFYDLSSDSRLGFMNINGNIAPNVLTLLVASGMMPHHIYTIAGVIMYEALS